MSFMSKIFDPGGYIAEKTTPKAFAPFSGLHGTWQAMNPKIDAPAAPAALPAAPGLNDPGVDDARRARLAEESKAKGRRSTLLTSSEGTEPGNIGRRTLLGA